MAWSRKRRTGFISRQGVWAVENGVTNGIGDGLFGPDNSCTRAQIVTFLFRADQGKKEPKRQGASIEAPCLSLDIMDHDSNQL